MTIVAPTPTAVAVNAAGQTLPGLLTLPEGATAMVVFAHGSGSSRLSPRNRWVAESLQRAGLGTLLFDLLTDTEAMDRGNAFDITLLADRLAGACRWCRARTDGMRLPMGLFGASTGAAAALVTAAREPRIHAVVSRGGRPDMASFWLDRVGAPTLLIVGGEDRDVLALNQQAFTQLQCVKRLDVVPHAGHLFEEPGTMEAVCDLARDWFLTHLNRAGLR
jgi:putative phosphoribosyl transferase